MSKAKADDGGRPFEEVGEHKGAGTRCRLAEDRPVSLTEEDLSLGHQDHAPGLHPRPAIELREGQLDLSGVTALHLGGRIGRARQEAVSAHRELPTQPAVGPTLVVDGEPAQGPIGQPELELAARRDHRGAAGDVAAIRPGSHPPALVLDEG